MTNKSILVIDTPERCADCDLFYLNDKEYFACRPVWLQVDKYSADAVWSFNPFRECRPECPLVAIEDAIEIIVKEYEDAKNN